MHQRRAGDARAADRRGPASRKQPAELSAARFDRDLDWRWRRTSYSDITAGSYEARVASEPEENVVDDEEPREGPAAPVPDEAQPSLLHSVPSLLADMPVGVHVGTFVHRVFEATDFAAPDLDAELATHVAAVLARRRVEVGDPQAVVAGLRAAIETPLGPLLGGKALRDIARADRLDELIFEMPLVGGDTPTGRLTLAAIGAVLREHLPNDDPLAGYADRLEDPILRQSLRGYLTGSIDLVVRSRRPLRHRRLQDELARARGRGADRLAPPPGRRSPPRCSTRTTRCRRCSTPSRCTATCAGACPATTPSATSRACSTCSCAGWSGPTRPRSTARRAASSPGGRRAALVEDLSDVLDRGAT